MNLSSVQPSVNVEYAPHTVNSLDKGAKLTMLENIPDVQYSGFLLETFIVAFAASASTVVLAGLLVLFVNAAIEYTRS